jgi:hypothetical protein
VDGKIPLIEAGHDRGWKRCVFEDVCRRACEAQVSPPSPSRTVVAMISDPLYESTLRVVIFLRHFCTFHVHLPPARAFVLQTVMKQGK